jgi:hypothetical protein
MGQAVHNNQYDSVFLQVTREISVKSANGQESYRIGPGMQFRWLYKDVPAKTSCSSCNANRKAKYLADKWAICPEGGGFISGEAGIWIPEDAVEEVRELVFPAIYTTPSDYYSARTINTTIPVHERPKDQHPFWYTYDGQKIPEWARGNSNENNPEQ